MGVLDDLLRLCPPPGVVHVAARPGAPDAAMTIPRDHRELVEAYGVGCFDDFLWIYGEGVANPHLDISYRTAQIRSALAGRVRPGVEGVLAEHHVGVGDLIKWGGTDNGDMLLWLPSGSPEEWPTLMIEVRQFSHQVVCASSTQVVFDLLTGRLRTDVFPEDFPSDRPGFHPEFRPVT